MLQSSMHFSTINGFNKLSKLFALRLMVNLGVYKEFFLKSACADDDFISLLGVTAVGNDGEYNQSAAIRNLKRDLLTSEKANIVVPAHTSLVKNLIWLKEKIGLSDLEQQLLLFFIVERQDFNLRKVTMSVGEMNTMQTICMIACAINASPAKVRRALEPSARLIKSGLVDLSHTYIQIYPKKIRLLIGLSHQMVLRQVNPFNLFTDNFKITNSGKLTPDNFPHLAQEIEHITSYLRQVMLKKESGVNILLYGAPGGGKTEFVRMIAKQLKMTLFEVAQAAQDDSPISANKRLQSFTLSQEILTQKDNTLLVFDEVEEVFSSAPSFDDGGEDSGSSSGRSKCWMNTLLEQNPVPAFWITNQVSNMDDAYLRRFDYHLEVKSPPRLVRLKIVEQYTKSLPVTQAWKNSIADNENVMPAVIERAQKVVKAMLSQQPSMSAEKAMTQIMANTLQAMGKNNVFPITATNIDYRLEVVNANCNLHDLAKGLMENPEARLCLYGPPGTGKTAFAHHLAQLLDKPLLTKRGSDIVSPYVGLTERNMAKMFKNAQAEGAVLLLDEADSFLRDRTDARNSWEVTAVNEMLTQMESYNGIFVASTNLINNLDSASLRRFDLKIEFGYMKPGQAHILLAELAKTLLIDLTETELNSLRQLDTLTPGDYANVARQARLSKIRTSQELLNRLENECKAKAPHKLGPMGFVA